MNEEEIAKLKKMNGEEPFNTNTATRLENFFLKSLDSIEKETGYGISKIAIDYAIKRMRKEFYNNKGLIQNKGSYSFECLTFKITEKENYLYHSIASTVENALLDLAQEEVSKIWDHYPNFPEIYIDGQKYCRPSQKQDDQKHTTNQSSNKVVDLKAS